MDSGLISHSPLALIGPYWAFSEVSIDTTAVLESSTCRLSSHPYTGWYIYMVPSREIGYEIDICWVQI